MQLDFEIVDGDRGRPSRTTAGGRAQPSFAVTSWPRQLTPPSWRRPNAIARGRRQHRAHHLPGPDPVACYELLVSGRAVEPGPRAPARRTPTPAASTWPCNATGCPTGDAPGGDRRRLDPDPGRGDRAAGRRGRLRRRGRRASPSGRWRRAGLRGGAAPAGRAAGGLARRSRRPRPAAAHPRRPHLRAHAARLGFRIAIVSRRVHVLHRSPAERARLDHAFANESRSSTVG